MSADIRFILLNPRQDPVKLSRGYLAAAESTNAADVHLEWGATVGAVEIRNHELSIGVLLNFSHAAGQRLARGFIDPA